MLACLTLPLAGPGSAAQYTLATDAGSLDVVAMPGGLSYAPETVAGTPLDMVAPEAMTLVPEDPYQVEPGPIEAADFTWQLSVPFGNDALLLYVSFFDLAGALRADGFAWDRGRYDILRHETPSDPESPLEVLDSVDLALDPLNFEFDAESGAGFPGTTVSIGPMMGNFSFLGFTASIQSPDFSTAFEPLPEPAGTLATPLVLAALAWRVRRRSRATGSRSVPSPTLPR